MRRFGPLCDAIGRVCDAIGRVCDALGVVGPFFPDPIPVEDQPQRFQFVGVLFQPEPRISHGFAGYFARYSHDGRVEIPAAKRLGFVAQDVPGNRLADAVL